MKEKSKILEEILGENKISNFSKNWVNSSNANEDSIIQVYNLLKTYGLSDEKIASQAHLLGRDPETIMGHYRFLRDLGLSDKSIATHASLLGLDPETVMDHYRFLRDLGLSDKSIATHAYLLSRDPETVMGHYRFLKALGLSDKSIASNAHLLGRDPETIMKYYQHHVGLLREHYKDRNSGRNLLIDNPQLLGISPETMEANIQYLHSIGIDYNEDSLLWVMLLGSKPSTKRKKLAWMLRELFDYRSVPQEKKKTLINILYGFVRNNPSLLVKSIKTLERKRDKLRERALNYKKIYLDEHHHTTK